MNANLARRSVLTVLALGAAGAAAAEAPADLAEAVRAYDQATVSNDIATLAQLVADDYVLVNSDSTLQDKQSYLADFRAPGFRLEPYVLEEPVHKAWGEAALIAGIVQLRWTLAGERHGRRLRIAHVWSKADGPWRLSYTQLTRIPDN